MLCICSCCHENETVYRSNPSCTIELDLFNESTGKASLCLLQQPTEGFIEGLPDDDTSALAQVLPLASLLAERGWARAALLLASDGVWCAPPIAIVLGRDAVR